MPQRRYTYNGVTIQATSRRPSSRDDKKYMREVTHEGDTRLVHYGDPDMDMQRDDPERRASFLARHQCDMKKDPFAPGFWACYDWANTSEGKSTDDGTMTVYLKSKTDDSAVVAGYGVLFGGTDLDGETFGPDTDYMLDLVPTKPVLYDHAMRAVNSIIGKVANIKTDDVGLWIEAELDRHNEYMAAVLELIEKGALGWSSGTVGQLARREGKAIRRWPIVEFSLTPTPAEPRTIGVERIKSQYPELLKLIPEAAEEAGKENPPTAAEDVNHKSKLLLEIDITEIEYEYCRIA